MNTARLTLLLFSVALLLTPNAVAAGDGKAVGVDPEAVAQLGGADRILVVGSDVAMGDTIVTGPQGRVQLLFEDETRIVVGSGSALRIETYLLNGSRGDRFAINALAGAFRFISGESPKPVYSIHTPTAAIAVRGTSFDLTVTRGASQVLLYDGALQLCHRDSCVDLTDRCDLGFADRQGSRLVRWEDETRLNMARSFPLANVQSVLLRPFRVAGAQACLSERPVNSFPSSSSTDNVRPNVIQPNAAAGFAGRAGANR